MAIYNGREIVAKCGPILENGHLVIMAIWPFETAILVVTKRSLNGFLSTSYSRAFGKFLVFVTIRILQLGFP